ncbi:uncharacterized protein LOC111345291 isoform X4 [Stylophora pistillata]|uniref:uncharacterized protein LOC111345291 isoform X4 n=1 Tax=Stylophora pistillata TaxID=50429 RepID=UPI000C04B80C|nr:uncharacterized protein LOC111345291 isoform X4 [Stylophora pistillata]
MPFVTLWQALFAVREIRRRLVRKEDVGNVQSSDGVEKVVLVDDAKSRDDKDVKYSSDKTHPVQSIESTSVERECNKCNHEGYWEANDSKEGMAVKKMEYFEQERNVVISCSSDECKNLSQNTMGKHVEQRECSNEQAKVEDGCDFQECENTGQNTMGKHVEQRECSNEQASDEVRCDSEECENISQNTMRSAISLHASEAESKGEHTAHTSYESGVKQSTLNPLARQFHPSCQATHFFCKKQRTLNPLAREFRPSCQTICSKKVGQPKDKSQMFKRYDEPPAQGRRRKRSCGPPKMLGVEAPPWSHPPPSHLPPRFPPSPPRRHYRSETPGVAPWLQPSVPNSWPTPPQMNIMLNAWPNTNRCCTDQVSGLLAEQNPSNGSTMRPMPGVLPWPPPFASNTRPTPSLMNVEPNTWPNNRNPDAYNPVEQSQGVAPWPWPSVPNYWPTLQPINIMPPNAWPNANMARTDQVNGLPAVQNPSNGSPIRPMPGVLPWPPPFASNTWPTPSLMNVEPNT